MAHQTATKNSRKQGADGNGTIVFVHGFHDGSEIWEDVIRELKSPGVRTISFDLAGMGERTTDTGPFTLERYSDQVGHILDRVDGPVVMVAHSMGAQIAELALASRATPIDGLLLIAPIGLAGAGMSDEASEQFKLLAATPDGERELRRMLMVSPSGPTFEKLVALGSRVLPDVSSQLVDAWNRGVTEGRGPSRYDGPVLVARGTEDTFVTLDSLAAHVLPRFKNPTSITVAKAGHWPQSEQPAAVAALIAEFVSQLGWPGALREGKPPADNTRTPASQGWSNAFSEKSESSFADSLASDVFFEASVMARPIEGRENAKVVLAAASKIYESLAFTKQTDTPERSYLEWEATAFGGQQIHGVTILTRNSDGKTARIAIHHRPLSAVLRFSAELGRRLNGAIASDYFYQDS